MTLIGKQLKALHQATLSAYPNESELAQELLFEMDITLNAVAQGQNHRDLVFNLLQFLKSEGRLLEWVVIAKDQNPSNAQIQAFAASVKHLLVELQEKLERDSLLELLHDREATLQLPIRRAYNLCRSEVSLNAPPTGLAATIEDLQDVNRGNGTVHQALHRFVALLTLPEFGVEEDLSDCLRQWLQSKVEDLEGIFKAVRSLLNEVEARAAVAQEAHLLIHVTQQSRSQSASALLITDVEQYDSGSSAGCQPIFPSLADPSDEGDSLPEQVTLETLPNLVRAYIEAASDAVGTTQDLVIHLILPLDWLQEDCDRWPCAELMSIAIPTGTRYQFVVRIAERLEKDYLNQFGKPWRDSWAALQKLEDEAVCSAFVLGDGLSAGTLYAQLNQAGKHGLKLTKSYVQTEFTQLFGMLIVTGTPAALWLRQDDCAESVVAVQAIDTLLNCKIATLPERVRLCRSDAMDAKQTAHIGRSLSLLWEDPKLIPPPETPFQMPA